MSYFEAIAEQLAQGRIEPNRGQIYSTHDLYHKLALGDAPFLRVEIGGLNGPVQTSHVTREQIDAWIEAHASEAKWRHDYITHEWIPLFTLQEGIDPRSFLDAEKGVDMDGEMWITPKGFPREQYRGAYHD
jgi:hypothetical protein